MSASKKMNIVDIENGLEEIAKKQFTPKEYGKELILLFSSPNTLKRISTNKANEPEFENGILWREKLHYAPCDPGDINQTLEKLQNSTKSVKAKVRLLIVNDGSHILVYDRKYEELTDCPIHSIKNEPQLFLCLTGQEGFRREEENDVDIKATGKLAKLYDELVKENPDWLEGEQRHSLNHFMTQIIFCLFAEDTDIFSKNILTKTLKNRAGIDGNEATAVLVDIFNFLDVADEKRSNNSAWLLDFPYVNGGLFSGEAKVPLFTPTSYRYLIEAASLDWKHINPDILGSSIQAIVDPKLRSNLGMHYTSVPNILKTLEPLFLNDLRDNLFEARHSKKRLNEFLKRLSKIVVFDPACGSGNFLVIAYRELRKLELQTMDALRDLSEGASMAFGFTSVISLSNFYGIEYADFAAETAKLALWIAEYQQNSRFSAAFGTDIPALPLRDSGNIECENALLLDWEKILPPIKNHECYLVGNPPYLGSKNQSKSQKLDMEYVCKNKISKYKSLDYVCAWFIKASELINETDASFSFVATNSICQGSHVPTLWPFIRNLGLEIVYAYQPFKWKNNAASNAGVTCVIVGVAKENPKRIKKLFSEESYISADQINGYLLPMKDILIKQSSKRNDGIPSLLRGSSPTDSGNLILSHQEAEELLERNPSIKPFLKRLIGSNELINNERRYVLYLKDASVEQLILPEIKCRLDAVEAFREKSPKEKTRLQAKTPHLFGEDYHHDSIQTMVIPVRSSENRPYMTPDIFHGGEVVTNLAFALYDSELWHLSIICCRMHLIWVDTVCGKLETRRTYSNTLGWNIFPMPPLSKEKKDQLNAAARSILLTRENHFPCTIADLYSPSKMPNDLRQAHEENDALIESFYREKKFIDDNERLNHLFELYVDTTKGSA
jgi:hypothetical protein